MNLGSDACTTRKTKSATWSHTPGTRGIRVVAGIRYAGHSTAWFVGASGVSQRKSPYAIERKWGIFDPAMDLTNEKVYKFLDDFDR